MNEEQKISDEELKELAKELIISAGGPYEDSPSEQKLHEDLSELIDRYSHSKGPRYKEFLEFHFGLKDGRRKSYEESAEKYGCSPERAKQIIFNFTRTMNLSTSHSRRYSRALSDFLNGSCPEQHESDCADGSPE